MCDPSIYMELCNVPVESYQKELDEGVPLWEIGNSLNTQMTELHPDCERFKELQEWGRKNLGKYYMEVS